MVISFDLDSCEMWEESCKEFVGLVTHSGEVCYNHRMMRICNLLLLWTAARLLMILLILEVRSETRFKMMSCGKFWMVESMLWKWVGGRESYDQMSWGGRIEEFSWWPEILIFSSFVLPPVLLFFGLESNGWMNDLRWCLCLQVRTAGTEPDNDDDDGDDEKGTGGRNNESQEEEIFLQIS